MVQALAQPLISGIEKLRELIQEARASNNHDTRLRVKNQIDYLNSHYPGWRNARLQGTSGEAVYRAAQSILSIGSQTSHAVPAEGMTISVDSVGALGGAWIANLGLDGAKWAKQDPRGTGNYVRTMQQRAAKGDQKAKLWLELYSIEKTLSENHVQRALAGDWNALGNIGLLLFNNSMTTGVQRLDRYLGMLPPTTRANVGALRKNQALQKAYWEYYNSGDVKSTTARDLANAVGLWAFSAVVGTPVSLANMAKNLCLHPVATFKGMYQHYREMAREYGHLAAAVDTVTGMGTFELALNDYLDAYHDYERIEADYRRIAHTYEGLLGKGLATQYDYNEFLKAKQDFGEAARKLNESRSRAIRAGGDMNAAWALIVGSVALKGAFSGRVGSVFREGIPRTLTNLGEKLARTRPVRAARAAGEAARRPVEAAEGAQAAGEGAAARAGRAVRRVAGRAGERAREVAGRAREAAGRRVASTRVGRAAVAAGRELRGAPAEAAEGAERAAGAAAREGTAFRAGRAMGSAVAGGIDRVRRAVEGTRRAATDGVGASEAELAQGMVAAPEEAPGARLRGRETPASASRSTPLQPAGEARLRLASRVRRTVGSYDSSKLQGLDGQISELDGTARQARIVELETRLHELENVSTSEAARRIQHGELPVADELRAVRGELDTLRSKGQSIVERANSLEQRIAELRREAQEASTGELARRFQQGEKPIPQQIAEAEAQLKELKSTSEYARYDALRKMRDTVKKNKGRGGALKAVKERMGELEQNENVKKYIALEQENEAARMQAREAPLGEVAREHRAGRGVYARQGEIQGAISELEKDPAVIEYKALREEKAKTIDDLERIRTEAAAEPSESPSPSAQPAGGQRLWPILVGLGLASWLDEKERSRIISGDAQYPESPIPTVESASPLSLSSVPSDVPARRPNEQPPVRTAGESQAAHARGTAPAERQSSEPAERSETESLRESPARTSAEEQKPETTGREAGSATANAESPSEMQPSPQEGQSTPAVAPQSGPEPVQASGTASQAASPTQPLSGIKKAGIPPSDLVLMKKHGRTQPEVDSLKKYHDRLVNELWKAFQENKISADRYWYMHGKLAKAWKTAAKDNKFDDSRKMHEQAYEEFKALLK